MMKYLNASVVLLSIAFVSETFGQLQTCTSRRFFASCHQAPHWGIRGRGCSPRVMYWYDRNTRSCRQMWYRGCGGNNNQWCNRQECERRCRR